MSRSRVAPSSFNSLLHSRPGPIAPRGHVIAGQSPAPRVTAGLKIARIYLGRSRPRIIHSRTPAVDRGGSPWCLPGIQRASRLNVRGDNMYNLNVNVNPSSTAAVGLLGVAAAEVTPRTPEIVNSLIAMTNPFEGYSHERSRDRTDSTSSGEPSPPSVQHTCSQLIKEGLKLTLQTKRRANGSGDECKKKSRKEDGSADDEEDDDSSSNNNSHVGLTPEDEERRRRRRERNKIAATKCRLKKREKTVILVKESEILETQNHDLKSQIQELETQRRRLVDMLSLHSPTCLKQGGSADTSYQQFAEPLPLPSYQENFAPPALNQPQNCVTEYSGVKVESSYETTTQEYYTRQSSPYVPTSDAGCTV